MKFDKLCTIQRRLRRSLTPEPAAFVNGAFVNKDAFESKAALLSVRTDYPQRSEASVGPKTPDHERGRRPTFDSNHEGTVLAGMIAAVRIASLFFWRTFAMYRAFQTSSWTLAVLSIFPFLCAGARAQGPTVTALPYVLTNQTGIIVVQNFPVVNAPPASDNVGFSSLLGGGLGSIITTPSAATGSAAATLSVRSLLYLKKSQIIQDYAAKIQQDAVNARNELQKEYPQVSDCDEETLMLRNTSLARNNKITKFNRKIVAADTSSGSCTLPEEEEAQEAEEELEALNQSGQASQDAIEAAEAAAEAAEEAATAAETALEAAADGLDVLEGVLDLVAVF